MKNILRQRFLNSKVAQAFLPVFSRAKYFTGRNACATLIIALTLSACISTKTATEKVVDKDIVKVVLLGGQSNMAGAGNYNNLSDKDKARIQKASENVSLVINGKSPVPLSYTTKKVSEKYNFAERFGPELFLGVVLSEQYPNQKFLFIKRSQGGTALYGAWNPNWSAEKAKAVEKKGIKWELKLYELHQQDIKTNLDKLKANGQAYEIMGMAWFQGENDAAKEVAARSYEENLKILIERYRRDLNISEMPFVMAQINSSYGKFRKEGPGIVRNAMETVANNDKKVDVIKTSMERSWSDYPKHSDNVHYNEVGQKRFGEAFAERLMKLQ